MRSKKAVMNIFVSFGLQMAVAISGLVVPRYILVAFGSNVNGLVSSITQFLSYIALVEGGIGGVTRAALYKPLAKKDTRQLSVVVNTTQQFFKRISYVFILYIILLVIFYPITAQETFSWVFTAALITILAINTFSQYFIGLTPQTLLNADQKQYIPSFVQIITTLLNMLAIVLLINVGSNIHVVKFASALIFLVRPLTIKFYVDRHYQIDKTVAPDSSSIKQRWDGMGHHIAYFIHHNTDVVILTLFSTLTEVSVYAVYRMVVRSITNIVKIFSTGIEAAFGNMISNEEQANLNKNFRMVDTGSSFITITVFSIASLTIGSFIRVYTDGITDADYIRPLFAQIILLAEAIYCLRLPYQSVTLAAGKFKETKNGAFVEAAMNILISIAAVSLFGLVGVAVGTFVAMTYRTVQFMFYANNHILTLKNGYLFKRQTINILTAAAILIGANLLPTYNVSNYLDWAINSAIIGVVAMIISSLINFIFYKEEIMHLFKLITNLFKKKK